MSIHIIDFRPPKIAQLLLLIALLLHWLTPLGGAYVYSGYLPGIAVGLLGFAVMMWGWWLFRKYDTAICPTDKNDFLVTSGIYRLSRNPMYLGMIAMLLGVALCVGSLPFYLATAVCFLVINGSFCPYEEAKLADTIGEAYMAYRRKVRRWI